MPNKKDCPRGFKFCNIQKKCVPIGDEAKDKLEMKYQRYFFKGKGPMEYNKVNEVYDLVDLALDEGFELFSKAIKAEKEVDKILNTLGESSVNGVDFGKGTIDTTGRPYDHPKKIRVVADVEECDVMRTGGMMGGGRMNKGITDIEPEESEEEYEDDYTALPNNAGENDIDHVPNQYGPALYAQIRKKMGEIKNMSEGDREAYKAYFDGMLKKFGVSSPAQLDGTKKKQFFNAVDKGWKAKKEKVSEVKSKMK